MNRLIDQLDRYPRRRLTLPSGAVQSWREAGAVGATTDRHAPLVLLHGISSGSGSWVQQLARLADNRRVLAWDAPGYGDSDSLPMPQPLASDYAERLHEWLDAMQINRCWLVGHSLGALQAAAFAHQWPQRLHGLVLISPAQGYGQSGADIQQQVFRKRPDLLARLGPQGMASQRASALLSASASPEQVALVAHGMGQLQMIGFSAASALLAFDHVQRYLPVQVPVRLLCGSADDITPPGPVQQLAQTLDCTYSAIPDAGHACYIEAPEIVSHQLLDFMTRTARAEPATETESGNAL